MRLAIVTETFPPEVNGVAMTFGIIAAELAARGHHLTIFRPERADLSAQALHSAYSIVTLPGFRIPGYNTIVMGFPARKKLSTLWKVSRPDLVHVVTEGPLGASAITAANDLGIPVTSSFHTNFHRYTGHYGFSPLRTITLAWLRRVHNRTLKTFAPTEELCRELSELEFKRLGLLSRGVNLKHFSPSKRCEQLREEWGAGKDNPVVIHVGRMAPEKNYDLLFRLYSAMAKVNPKLKFVLLGEGPLETQLRTQHPECVFAGFFPREEIGRYYASADIYIHASNTETFGNVITEAMASGLAVASYDYAAAKIFIRNEASGLVAPFNDEALLTKAAEALATNETLREKLRTAAPLALSEHSWEKIIVKFENELSEVIHNHRPS
jgi:glycosyltransferase involved in cell wall biosynthesis